MVEENEDEQPDAPRDPAISRQPVNAGGHAGELQLVERVRHRARIETAETRDLIVHVSSK